MGEKGVDQ
jgi:hypothetical protein